MVELGEVVVELHEKPSLITFRARRVRICTVAHLVVMLTYFQSLCSNRCKSFWLLKNLLKNCWIRWRICQIFFNTFVIIFWTIRVKMCMMFDLVAMTTYIQRLCNNRCQFFDIYKKLSKYRWIRWKNVELQVKHLLITFWTRRVKMWKIAHLVVMTTYFESLCTNRCQSFDFYDKFSNNCWIGWRKLRTSW